MDRSPSVAVGARRSPASLAGGPAPSTAATTAQTRLQEACAASQGLLSPCASFTLYLDAAESAGIAAFLECAAAALGPSLTHFVADTLSRPRRVSARLPAIVDGWFGEDAHAHRAHLLDVFDVPDRHHVAGRSRVWISVAPQPNATLDSMLERRRAWEIAVERGERPSAAVSVVHLAVPLDHPLAAPRALAEFVTTCRLVRGAPFLWGRAGLGIQVADDPAAWAAVPGLVARWPGLDWFNPTATTHVLQWDPLARTVAARIFRADWLTLIGDRLCAALGGRLQLATQLRTGPGVRVSHVNNGLVVYAGPAPALGEAGEGLTAYRHVARHIRAVRLAHWDGTPHRDNDAWVTAWLAALD